MLHYGNGGLELEIGGRCGICMYTVLNEDTEMNPFFKKTFQTSNELEHRMKSNELEGDNVMMIEFERLNFGLE